MFMLKWCLRYSPFLKIILTWNPKIENTPWLITNYLQIHVFTRYISYKPKELERLNCLLTEHRFKKKRFWWVYLWDWCCYRSIWGVQHLFWFFFQECNENGSMNCCMAANCISILYYFNSESIHLDCYLEKLNVLSIDFGLDKKGWTLSFQMRF